MKENTASPQPPKQRKKRTLKIFLVVFVLINLSFYQAERRKHVNDVYPEAREYFVLNNVVYAYRVMLNSVFDADSAIMKPLNKLQSYLYNKGIKYIPEDDAERALWNYKFNLYFYVRKNHMPKEKYYPSPYVADKKQTDLLDNVYQTMIELDAKKFKDPNLSRENYKLVPILAEYFVYFTYLYAGHSSKLAPELSKKALVKQDVIDKNKRIVEILSRYHKNINEDKSLKRELETANDSILRSLYIALIAISQKIIYADILKNNLSCDNQYINTYLNAMNFAYSGDKPFFASEKYKNIQYIIDINLCENLATKTTMYSLNKTCGVKIDKCYPDKEYINDEIVNKPRDFLN